MAYPPVPQQNNYLDLLMQPNAQQQPNTMPAVNMQPVQPPRFNRDMLTQMLLGASEQIRGTGTPMQAISRGIGGAAKQGFAYRQNQQQDSIYRQLLGKEINIPEGTMVTPDVMKNIGTMRTLQNQEENAKVLNQLRLKQAETLGGTFGGSKDPYLQSIDYLLNQGAITQEDANSRLLQWQLNRANNPDYKGEIKYSEKTGTNLADINTGGKAEYSKQTGKNQSDLEFARDTKFQEFLGSKGYNFKDGQITPIKGTDEDRERFSNYSKAEEGASFILKSIDEVLTDEKGLNSSVGGPAGILGKFTEATGGVTEAQRNFQPKIDQLKGQMFMEAYKTLKGGGQITEIEGIKATEALARINQAQSVESFKKGLKDLKEVVETVRNRERNLYNPAGGKQQQRQPANNQGWQQVGEFKIRVKGQ